MLTRGAKPGTESATCRQVRVTKLGSTHLRWTADGAAKPLPHLHLHSTPAGEEPGEEEPEQIVEEAEASASQLKVLEYCISHQIPKVRGTRLTSIVAEMWLAHTAPRDPTRDPRGGVHPPSLRHPLRRVSRGVHWVHPGAQRIQARQDRRTGPSGLSWMLEVSAKRYGGQRQGKHKQEVSR